MFLLFLLLILRIINIIFSGFLRKFVRLFSFLLDNIFIWYGTKLHHKLLVYLWYKLCRPYCKSVSVLLRKRLEGVSSVANFITVYEESL